MARGNFGERLKRERELREVSMDELTKATRISTRFVEALENEDWAKLPGGVFGHGFVRTIARYLGLNEEALLGEYDLARADHLAAAPAKPENRIPSPPKWLPVAAVLIVLLLIAGLFYAGRYGWRRYAASRAPKKSAAASSTMRPLLQSGSHLSESAEQSSSVAPSVASSTCPLNFPSPLRPPRASASSRTINFYSTPSCPPGRTVIFRLNSSSG